MRPYWGGGIEVYKHHSLCERIDYIHFIDSDDYFRLDCIQKCVGMAIERGLDIVWHSFLIYDQEEKKVKNDFRGPFEDFFDFEHSYTPLEIFERKKDFSWSCGGIYRFYKEMKQVRFIESIESEDSAFGMMIFSLAKNIGLLNEDLHIYRMRSNSTSQHTINQSNFIPKWPEYMQDIVEAFSFDHLSIRYYHFSYSHCRICIEMDNFIQTHSELDIELRRKLRDFVTHRAFFAFRSCCFGIDPRSCRILLKELLHYKNYVGLGNKIAYDFPKIYLFFKKIKSKINTFYLLQKLRFLWF